MLIDTHAHLNFKAFSKIIDQVLWQASEAGVEKIIVPGTDLESSQKAVNLAKHFVNVYASVGIHPHHVGKGKSKKEKIKNKLKKLAKNNKVVAIGECGLDYYQYPKTKYNNYQVDKDFKKRQKEIFIMQLKLAQEINLPVIIHNRKSGEDIKKMLNDLINSGLKVRGVFHCFEGDGEFLDWALSKGFYIGFDGNVTYNKELMKLVKAVPLNRVLLETDSPFLTPEPLRSQKNFPNKPENVKIVAQFIAKLHGDSFFKISKQTTKNAEKLFFR